MTLPATDSFTRADGALGANWAGSVGSDLSISSNEVTGASATDSAMYWTTDTPNNDQRAKCTLKAISAGQYAGPFVRGSATDLVVLLAQSNTDYQIQWYNGGAWTQIGSTYAVAPANGDVLEIRVEGNTYKGIINGVERISGTNSSAPASGNGGLYVYSNSARVDDFEVDNLATLEQEGSCFGVDDGNEASHTLNTQDTNISTAAGESRLLRLLVNATGGPVTIAPKLKYQKNGTGGYATVPIGATTKTKPVIEAADCTVSGSNTASSSWAVSHPAASAGDLLTFNIAWDDSTTTTGVTPPSGVNGETLTAINSTPATDASTETRAKSWSCICTGSWTATTITFTPSASESWSATVIRVPAGEFDATTPIGTSATRGATGLAETSVLSPAMTAGASDGGGVLVWLASVDVDPLGATNPTGWTILQRQDLGAVAHGVAVRNTEVSNSESIAGGDTWAIAGDSWASVAYIIRAPVVNNDYYITTSANIAAGGEATTARLTAPAAKSTSDFVAGGRWGDENGTDTTNITTDDYSEFEYFLTVRSGLSASDYFDSRLYNGDTALDTYTNTPRWTISSAVTLTVADATHTHAADAIALTASNYLAVTDATHTHAADAIALTANNTLAVTDATHTHSADAITLTLSVSLSVTDATHTHAADAIVLTLGYSLVITDATHTHAADAIALTANNTLAVTDATHTHAADAISLTSASHLTVTDATHTHTADDINLSTNGSTTLTLADPAHTHSADAVTLTVNAYLEVTEATHAHSADAVTLTLGYLLAVTDAAHTHSADAIALNSLSYLAVSDAAHEHTADVISLSVPVVAERTSRFFKRYVQPHGSGVKRRA